MAKVVLSKPAKKDQKAAKAAAKKVPASKSPPSKAQSLPKKVAKVTKTVAPKTSPTKKSTSVPKPQPAKKTKPTKPAAQPVKSASTAKSPKVSRAPPTPVKAPSKALKTSEAKVEKVLVKGNAAVDKLVPNGELYRVYQDSNRIYSATLNQSNIDANNNKFYIIQVLLNQKTGEYTFWTRWGRVGVPGQNVPRGPIPLQLAISEFNSKLKDKTAKGNYKELEIKFDDGAEDKKTDKVADVVKAAKTGTSKLDSRVQKLISLIFDTGVINTAMKEIGYDSNKTPLGKLGDATIKEAYGILGQLATAISKGNRPEISSLSSQFFTLIPHDVGFAKMSNFILDTNQKVKKKLEMLADISDMKITTKMLATTNAQEDIIDQNYKKLACSIEALDQKSKQFEILSNYLHNTKEGWKINIDEIYKIHRPTEQKSYNTKLGNKMLLWHGSRIANFVGILSQGLRIAPPEAPVSGYLFGKGIYLADMIDKSASYCRSYGSDTALCLLIEGALGDPNILLNSNCQAKDLMDASKKNHTKCHGRKAPNEKSYIKLGDFMVPQGKPEETKSGSSMGHNQFIIYDTNQAKIRYVVKMNMK